MSVLINFKICDNSKDCSGIDVCPTDALFWDEENKTIVVNGDDCIVCGACEPACPVGAIRVASDEDEYARIRKEIDEDPRNVSDLFVDRYGAEPIDAAFLIPQSKFDVQILQSSKPAVAELFDGHSLRCLLFSIPIQDLFKNVDIKYRKIWVSGKNLLDNYGVQKLPALLFFQSGTLVGKIEGYFSIDEKDRMMEKVNDIVSTFTQGGMV